MPDTSALWFLIFLYGAGDRQLLPMHSEEACLIAATSISELLETRVMCISPDTGLFIVFDNGTLYPTPPQHKPEQGTPE